MKKILFCCIIFFFATLHSLNAQNPIPSYNFPVYPHANFMEQRKGLLNSEILREKRTVIVRTTCNGSGITNCSATVWVYSLDRLTVYGPYTVYDTGPLSVEIDEREWGVYVTSSNQVVVDVWIE